MARIAIQPPSGSGKEVAAAFKEWARKNPAHAKWITEGAPGITSDEEHRARFGSSYEGSGAKKK